jgi:hypothetical protein
MRWQYEVADAPTRFGTLAFVPVPASVPTAATNGQNHVVGMPGTVAIPSPRPAAMNDGELGGPYNQPSSVAPDVFYPSIYFVPINPTMTFDGLGTGLTRGNDHPIPAPVGAVTRVVGNFMHRFRVGGQTVTRAVRPFTQWPTYGGGSN